VEGTEQIKLPAGGAASPLSLKAPAKFKQSLGAAEAPAEKLDRLSLKLLNSPSAQSIEEDNEDESARHIDAGVQSLPKNARS